MTLSFTSGTKSVTATETDIFTPLTTSNYRGLYVFLDNMVAGHTVDIKVQAWDNVTSTYKLLDPFQFIGVQTVPANFIPLLPGRRFKITVMRTGGTDFNMNYDLVTQTG